MSISLCASDVSYGPGQEIVDRDLAAHRTGRGPGRLAFSAVHTVVRSSARVGLAQRSADGAAVAHHRVGDDTFGVAEDRDTPRPARRDSSSFAVPRHRTDPHQRRLDAM